MKMVYLTGDSIAGVLNRISLAFVGYSLSPTRCRFKSRLPSILLLEHGDALEGGGSAVIWVSTALDKSLSVCERA